MENKDRKVAEELTSNDNSESKQVAIEAKANKKGIAPALSTNDPELNYSYVLGYN